MSHVEYDAWVQLIHQVLARFNFPPTVTILELGAGTGVLGSKLVSAGHRYLGTDLSWPMCRQALMRRSIPMVCCDGRAIPVRAAFDLAVFLYDGINYLQTGDDYAALFRQVYDRLNPGGLFLFDITTAENSRRYFLDILDAEDFGDWFYLRHSYYETENQLQHNNFTIFAPAPDNNLHYVKSRENHVQKVFAPQTIQQWIPRDMFDIEGIWDGFSCKNYSRRSTRIHFLLHRKNGSR